MARNIIAVIVGCAFVHLLSAQNFIMNPHKGGNNLFAGGIDNPRFQFIDIDGDHDEDLFIFDKDERLWFYRNVNGSFRLEPDETFGLTIGSWFRFVDIDGDGDFDCMTNGSFSEVAMFINIGSPTSPKFQLTTPAILDTSGTEMFSERFSIPTFADMDGDGDLDFFTGSSIGSVTYYKNVGSKFLPKFAFVTSAYQAINIQGTPNTFPKPMHGASGIEFFDADSNGVLDLFWGDLFNKSLYFLKNSGTKQNASIALIDSSYPKEDLIATFGFNIPQHVDVDQNGTIDLMIGCVTTIADYNNFMFYKNIGTNTKPFYELQTKNFIPMIDVGSRSSVAAADFDGDGDIDLCVSSGNGTVNIFQNTGSRSAPQYSSVPTSTIVLSGSLNLTVAAGDLNGDNLPDILIGTYEDGLKAYINLSAGGMIKFEHNIHPVEGAATGQSLSPTIADIDQDGKIDVLVGNSGGQLTFLKNVGTNISPQYVATNNFNAIDAGNDAIPCICDIDNDGIQDLLIGNRNGQIWYYRQAAAGSLVFNVVTSKYQNIDLRTQSAPAVVDFDNDGDNDLLLGNGKGGIFFYENTNLSSVSQKAFSEPMSMSLMQNYPNPFNPSTVIQYQLWFDGFVMLNVYDMLGNDIATLVNEHQSRGLYSIQFKGIGLSSGVYYYRLQSAGRTETKKFILVK